MGRSRTLLVVLVACVALLGVAAYWLFVVQPVASLGVGELPASEPAPAEASASGEPAVLAPPPADTRAPQRAEASSKTPPAPARPAGPTLLAVDASTQRPLADATVVFLETKNRRRRGIDDLAELVALAERQGKRVRTADDGTVALPAAKGEWFAVVSTKDRFGAGSVRAGQEGIVFPLYIDGPLEIFVHDSEDRPVAGVALALTQNITHTQGLAFNQTVAPIQTRARRADAISDAAGRAVFEHGRAWIERAGSERLVVVADGMFAKVPKREVGLDDLGSTIPLEVPPFGSIEVRVRDFEDRELVNGAQAMVSAKSVEPAIGADYMPELRDRRVLYPTVEVGLDVHFEASLRIGKELVGPVHGRAKVAKTGERVELVLGGANSIPILVLRAVDEALAPLANTSIDVQSVDARSSGFAKILSPVVSDAEGRVKLLLPGWPNGGGALRLVAPPTAERKLRTAIVDVPRTLVLGEQSLGDVVLSGLPLLVSGRVVDQLGAPVENAKVEVLSHGPAGRGWTDARAAALTDGDGAFSIDADPPVGELGIRAGSPDSRRCDVLPFARGSVGIELVVERWASLDGIALIDPDLAPAEVNVHWFTTLESGASQDLTIVGQPAKSTDGLVRASFRNDKLRAGRGKLEVRAVSTTVLTFDPVELRPGPNPDVLRDIDLRQLIRIFNLTIRDHQGNDLAAGEIHFRASGSDEPWQLWQFTRGRARILALAPELDLSIFGAPGRETLFERVRGSSVLVLDGPIWTKLELVGGNPLRAPDTLGLVIELVEPRGPTLVPALRNGVNVQVDDDGRALVAFAAPGKYSVAFQVGCASRGTAGRVGPKAELEIEVRDGEQELTVSVPRAAIEQLYTQLLEAPEEKR